MQIPNFTIGDHNREAFCMLVKALPTGHLYTGKVIEKKSARSLEQNNWMRKYARDFGAHFGYDADFAYDMLMYKFNPVFRIIDGDEIRMPGSFSKLDTKEAADVQDACMRYGIDNGFYWDAV
jgi:hypothetical protein